MKRLFSAFPLAALVLSILAILSVLLPSPSNVAVGSLLVLVLVVGIWRQTTTTKPRLRIQEIVAEDLMRHTGTMMGLAPQRNLVPFEAPERRISALELDNFVTQRIVETQKRVKFAPVWWLLSR